MKGRAFVSAIACGLLISACGGSSDTTIPSAPGLAAGSYQLVSVNSSPLPFTDPTTGSKITAGVCVIRTDATFTATFTLIGGTAAGSQILSGYITHIDSRSAEIYYGNGIRTIGTLTSSGFVATVGLVAMEFTRK